MKDWHTELGVREVPPDEDEEETLRLQIEDEDAAISFIVESMKLVEEQARADNSRGQGLDISSHWEALRWLLRKAQTQYNMHKSYWLHRNSPEGSDWRPYRQLEKNFDPEERAQEPTYDYGEHAGDGFDQSWDEWWRENWGKGRGNPGNFRDDPEIPKKPLIAIYFLVNEWYRRVLDACFWPDYSSGIKAASNDIDRLPHIGPAARLLFLVANEIDEKHTMDRCKKVHEDYYKKLPKNFVQR